MTARTWYRDRDFPEIKVSNAEILLVISEFPQNDKIDALCKEHNDCVAELLELRGKMARLAEVLAEVVQ